jgi:hypothetical protein
MMPDEILSPNEQKQRALAREHQRQLLRMRKANAASVANTNADGNVNAKDDEAKGSR